MIHHTLGTLALIVLAGCATGARVEHAVTLPDLPHGARAVLVRPLPCPQGFGVFRGYDTNGNGDYEMVEVWLAGERVAVILYDEATEQEVVAIYVKEGHVVTRYTFEEVQARYPTLCHLLAAPKAV